MDRSSLGWEGECSRWRNHKCKGPEVSKRDRVNRGEVWGQLRLRDLRARPCRPLQFLVGVWPPVPEEFKTWVSERWLRGDRLGSAQLSPPPISQARGLCHLPYHPPHLASFQAASLQCPSHIFGGRMRSSWGRERSLRPVSLLYPGGWVALG